CRYSIRRNAHIFTQSPFHIIAHYFLIEADILHSMLTVETATAWYHRSHRHWRSHLVSLYLSPHLIYMTRHFMTQDGGQRNAFRFFATEYTHIGTTDGVGSHLDEHLVRPDFGRI